MRIAIAGHRAMLGQALGRQAAEAGWSLTKLGRDPTADLLFDARSPPLAPDLSGCDALIICMAAYGQTGPGSESEAYDVNLLAALTLLEAAAAGGVDRVVYVSSTSALQPQDVYGRSKAAAEASLVRLAPIAGVKLTLVRPSQMYDSSGDAASRQPFLYGVIDQVASGRPVKLAGAEDVDRNYVHVEDVARAVLATIRHGLDGTFNAVHPQSLKVSEVVRAVGRACGRVVEPTFEPARPALRSIVIPQQDNLFRQLGFAPRSFEAGMDEVMAHRAAVG